MYMHFNINKFKRPYTVPKKGRGATTIFSQSPIWQQNVALKMWDTYKTTGCKFELLWGPANIAKSHFAITFGEALPFLGNIAIVSHTTNITNQHNDLIEHYKKIGHVAKNTKSLTIHQVYSWIQKLKGGFDIKDEDKDFLMNTVFITVDELHKYSKSTNAKMLKTVCDYLLQKGKLKLVLGTTMTGKYINTIWQWAGTFPNRIKFTFRPDVKDLKKDGLAYPNNVEYINVDSKTKVFDKQYTDSLNIRATDSTFDQYCKELINADPDDAVENLKNEDHKLKFRIDPQFRIEQLAYQDNRVKVAIDCWSKIDIGQPAIINVRGVINAQYYAKIYSGIINALGYEIISWNGEAKRGQNANPVYKNDERKMLDDLCNPNHPLKIVITNGMLREGTNEEIEIVYQCAFTPGGSETSIQLGQRGRVTVIMLDAMNIAKMPTSGFHQQLKKTLKEVFGDRTEEELLNALAIEQQRQESQYPNHKKPNVWEQIAKDLFDNPEPGDTDVTDDGTPYTTILSRDTWVKDVEYVGNHKTKNVALHNNHQNLIDALDIGHEAVDVR